MHALDTSSHLNIYEIFSHLDAAGKKAAQAQKHTQANAIYAEAWHIMEAVHNKETFSKSIQTHVIDFLSRYARCLSHCSLHTQASQIIEQALSFILPNTPEQEARVRQIGGYIYKAMGHLDSAEQNYLQARQICQQLENRPQEAYINHHLMLLYERLGKQTEASKLAHSLAKLSELMRMESGRLEYHARIACIQFQYHNAQPLLENALNALRENNAQGSPQAWRCLKTLGAVTFYTGAFERSQTILEKIRHTSQKEGTIGSEIYARLFLGRLAKEKGDIRLAEVYLTEAESLKIKIENTHLLCMTRAFLASIKAAMGDSNGAMKWANRARQDIWKNELFPERTFVHCCLGKAFTAAKNYKEAEAAFNHATDIPTKLQGGEWALANIEAGKFYIQQENFVTAQKHLERAAESCRHMGMPYFEKQAMDLLNHTAKPFQKFSLLVGQSQAMQHVYTQIAQASETDITVLLTGETGTGKDLAAQTIHNHSHRKGHPFISLNCASLSPELLQSELFGHKKGGFTSANESRMGLFETADSGTLFLDEIADASPQMQASLLRVLQSGEIRRLGENQIRHVNVRIIVASNRGLETEVNDGRFREDLYYRLKMFQIEMPRLKDRIEDIPMLTHHFLNQAAPQTGPPKKLTLDAMQSLMTYPWPGNVRELENELIRALTVSKDYDEVTHDCFSQAITHTKVQYTNTLKKQIEAFEKQTLTNTLKACQGNVNRAAVKLGISRSGFYNKMAYYAIQNDA